MDLWPNFARFISTELNRLESNFATLFLAISLAIHFKSMFTCCSKFERRVFHRSLFLRARGSNIARAGKHYHRNQQHSKARLFPLPEKHLTEIFYDLLQNIKRGSKVSPSDFDSPFYDRIIRSLYCSIDIILQQHTFSQNQRNM